MLFTVMFKTVALSKASVPLLVSRKAPKFGALMSQVDAFVGLVALELPVELVSHAIVPPSLGTSPQVYKTAPS